MNDISVATSPIGNNAAGLSAADAGGDLAGKTTSGMEANASALAINTGPAAIAKSNLLTSPLGDMAIGDISAVLISEVATSDISKLGSILDPQPDSVSIRTLDTLRMLAVQEITKGNAERAVGYLADYATRDPRRAEALPLEPDLAAVRDKIKSMVTRMTVVARMSAEDELSRAEQSASEKAGKLADWDTHADVLIKLAHHLFEAGGYANYSRTSELARLVRNSVAPAEPMVQAALAASATASPAPPVLQSGRMIQGLDVPYWVAPDTYRIQDLPDEHVATRGSPRHPDDIPEGDMGNMLTALLGQLWRRAPLLVLMLAWLFAGGTGGVLFVMLSKISPESATIATGNSAFDLWGIGCLALVGYGFYMRVR